MTLVARAIGRMLRGPLLTTPVDDAHAPMEAAIRVRLLSRTFKARSPEPFLPCGTWSSTLPAHGANSWSAGRYSMPAASSLARRAGGIEEPGRKRSTRDGMSTTRRRAPDLSHAAFMRHVLDDKLVERVVQIGLRAVMPASPKDVPPFTVEPIVIGATRAATLERAALLALIPQDHDVYITLDIDVVDPAFADQLSLL